MTVDLSSYFKTFYLKGRRLRSKLRLKRYLNDTYFGNLKSFQGIIGIGLCKDNENFIMSTYLVSDKTIKASEEVINKNKENESSNIEGSK